MKSLFLFREDLRLFDNQALSAAAKGKLALLFICPDGLGGASRWWLHHSLKALQNELAKHHITLILRSGDPTKQVLSVAQELKVDRVMWNRVYSPQGMAQGNAMKQALKEVKIEAQSFNGQLLIEPTKVLTQQDTPYKVFTPFWRACREWLAPAEPLENPVLSAITHELDSDNLDDWALLPRNPDWSTGLAERWQPGEQGAQDRWQTFKEGVINDYQEGRDFPAKENTSFLSPHLTFGEISVRQIWHEAKDGMLAGDINETNGNKFLSEIGWREFSRYLLVHFPKIVDKPFNSKFEDFPWQDSPSLLTAWQKGRTGYPIVDAGMRELWATGYMHNRVRMIVASFLTKHCLTHWQHGQEWFWDTLVDADIGNNTASWQWAAGCGADAAPYFRIFNPILQSEKFDKKGAYIRKWVPELKSLEDKYLHKPWEAGEERLAKAGIELGHNYPMPIVDHATARQSALDAYQAIKSAS
jgi:deoxyribodipyrimidine photo-lyase